LTKLRRSTKTVPIFGATCSLYVIGELALGDFECQRVVQLLRSSLNPLMPSVAIRVQL